MSPNAQNEETLLDRLKRVQASSDITIIEETSAESKLVSRDFGQLARIALTLARTECLKADNTDKLAVLRQVEIVPDDVIPNAHNNEVGLTSFVRSNLPQENWPMFIDTTD